MIAASRTVLKRARELLAILAAIMFLFTPMAEAGLVKCEPHIVSSEDSVSPQGDPARHADFEPGDQKACCKSACSLCNALFPAPVLFAIALKPDGHRELDPHRTIAGINSRPAIGPPRSA
ncbi:hypothetical protein [Ensifer sp. LCM 4579]|uniref:hypothetical protein n=1 Tax=Ensifer sp. LCM 4579 TaxID=1848292 RepID=UPI0008D9ACB8|nr:hypothetical protein [Ensifer sp. LCM 4579]OHV78574.1 hypothetical protein LCM4579_25445 [Ensifer sp. LCM 4579]